MTKNLRNKIFLQIAILISIFNGAWAQSSTFNYTGAVQTWTVPPCVTTVTVDVWGAMGGGNRNSRGGYGGRVQCNLSVTPGTVLDIYVGGKGDTANPGASMGGAGGYNGGANGSYSYSIFAGGGGGGASDIRIPPYNLSSRLVVAGGAGAAGYDCNITNSEVGGDGGGLTGMAGADCGSTTSIHVGGGGTPTAGGAAGTYVSWVSANPGTFGVGGDAGVSGTGTSNAGGGGGGGWYGGGGGDFGGGGGGSSYTDPTLASSVTHTQGFNTTGDGKVVITVGCTPPGSITGSTLSVCESATITLNDPTSVSCGTWSSSNTAIAAVGSGTGIVTGVSAGTATITYNVPSPCGGSPATQTITVNPVPSPITGTTSVCVGGTTTLADATAFGGWFSLNPSIATVGITSGVVTGVSMGAATIDYALVTACVAQTTVNVNCVSGVGQVSGADVYKAEIYPSPARSEIILKTVAGIYQSFAISNDVGQVLVEQPVAGSDTQVDIRQLPAGVYYVKFRGDYGTTTGRFVKIE